MYRDYEEYMRNVLNYKPNTIPNNYFLNNDPLNQMNPMNNNYQYRQFQPQNLNGPLINNFTTKLNRPPHVKKQNININQNRSYLQF